MKQLLIDTIKKFLKQADYLEIRVEKSEVFLISFLGPNLENISRSTNLGGSIRAMTKGGWGFVSFNSLENLDEKVLLAIRQ